MALIRTYQTVENDVFIVRLEHDLSKLSQADADAIAKFGEPEIQVGGVFLEDDVDGNEFTFPGKFVKLVSGFPVVGKFDSRDTAFSTNTALKAEAFRTEILARATAAFTALRNEYNALAFEKELASTI